MLKTILQTKSGVGVSPARPAAQPHLKGSLDRFRAGGTPTPRVFVLLSMLYVATFAHAQDKPATTQPAATQPAASQPADYGKPTDSLPKPGPRAAKFLEMHQQFLDRIKSGKPIDLLFMGDSITAGWDSRARDLFAKRYGPMNAANFGIGGDQTQNVIWRIENGELDGFKPKVMVLMIGTNNTSKDSPTEIAAAVKKIISITHAKLPETKILLLGVFPRAKARPEKDSKAESAPLSEKIGQINEIISTFDDGKTVRYLDIGPKFLNEKGELPTKTFADGLHPSAEGYVIWADAMEPLLEEMMRG